MKQVITARYPANIALVKYWGKRDNQIPCNPSLSLTLSQAFTEVKLLLFDKKSKEPELEYFFEGQPQSAFKERILKYIAAQDTFSELLRHFSLRIESKNSFPHSTGIASSASAFAAIAAVFAKASNCFSEQNFKQKTSCLARLGSGSACRSFYGPFALWGKLEKVPEASDEYAVPVTEIHDNFKNMKDSILIVDDAPKKVSSSVGHSLMKDHPYAAARFQDARQHCNEIISVLRNGDFDLFISITEREALSLHAMMMTSRDYYMLMKPQTVQVIEQIIQFRKDTRIPLCFSLDAGPNVHLIYPESVQNKIQTFLQQNLHQSIQSVIADQAGKGGGIF